MTQRRLHLYQSFPLLLLFYHSVVQAWVGTVQPTPRGMSIRQRRVASLQQQHPLLASSRKSSSSNNDDAENDSIEPKRKKKTTRKRKTTAKKQQDKATTAAEKKMRVAAAETKVASILAHPDAPIDVEAELEKVVSIAPPFGSLSEEEIKQEATLAALEERLYQAVKEQAYDQAAATKQEINQLHLDDCGAVIQVNAAYYKAFSRKDYDQMETVWLADNTVTCIHPSSHPLVGAVTVMASWKRMFDAASVSFQRTWVEPHQIRVAVQGAHFAVVTCEERVFCRRFVRGKKRETERVNTLQATNLFRKVAGRWYICHHHSSWHADSAAARQALKLPARKPQHDPTQSSNSEEENDKIRMDGILGIGNTAPLLGTEGGKEQKPVKKIVMGNLNSLLSGELGDLLGGSPASSNDGDDSASGDSTDDSLGGAVIHFSSADKSDEDDDDDEVGDDGNEDDDGEENGLNAVAIINDWNDNNQKDTDENRKEEAPEPKDALRQDCITALRRLCEHGAISPKQKRLLLTDIITCSSKGEFSMVEVAYELLYGEGDEKDVSEEEFADQCRYFAIMLLEESTPADE